MDDAEKSLVGAPPLEDGEQLLARRPDFAEAINFYASRAKSKSARKALESDWKVFSAWCAAEHVAPLPATPATVAAFLSHQAGGKGKTLSTILRYRSSISYLHQIRGHKPPPTQDARVKEVLEGIRREKGANPPNRKRAFNVDHIGDEPASGPRELRDRAIVLVGFASAMRRSELCALDIEDIEWRDGGAVLSLRWSKTDQHGHGRTVGIPLVPGHPGMCPATALRAWLEVLGETIGPVFRGFYVDGRIRKTRLSPRYVAVIAKAFAERAGEDPALYGGHSLRSGYVTAARRAGRPVTEIMEQTGHRKPETVLIYDQGVRDPFKASGVASVLAEAFKWKEG